MAGARILETRNAGLFELMAFNRDVKKTAALEASMKKHGWIDGYPMLVKMNGGDKLLIKDGHHRFEVAQRLGLPFKYVISSDQATMFELNNAVNKWSPEDFLNSYIREGKQEYVRVAEYIDKTGIALGNAVAMLYGHSGRPGGSNSEALANFKKGVFACKGTNHAEVVGNIVSYCRKNGVAWAGNSRFVAALSRVVWVPEFSASRFKAKIKAFTYLMEKQATVDNYLELIEMIYNYKSQDKMPLKFLAEQAAKERNAVKV